MEYYHVLIQLKDQMGPIIKFDFEDCNVIIDKFVKPHIEKIGNIVVSGQILEPNNIKKILIRKSRIDKKTITEIEDRVLKQKQAESARKKIHMNLQLTPASIFYSKETTDVTDEVYENASNKGTIFNIEKSTARDITSGNNIFIGHGRSGAWRDLKDFLKERLKLSVVEFNSEPVAGTTTVSRLQNMLNSSSFAFLIMTAEDQQPNGEYNARMNVIHEVGLFQGRLGFDRAIILLENGCSEFSNITGLSYIKFSPNNIKESFEEIRRVLEKHNLIRS